MASEPRYSLGQFTLALVPDTTTFRLRNPLMLLIFMLVCSFIFKIFIVLLEILSFYTFLYSRIYFKSLQKAKLLLYSFGKVPSFDKSFILFLNARLIARFPTTPNKLLIDCLLINCQNFHESLFAILPLELNSLDNQLTPS